MEDQQLINTSIEMDTERIQKVDISEADKERFLKSVLSDKPYEEEVSILDGQLSLRFKAMSVQENTDVVNQIVLDRNSGVAADTDAYFITVSTYRLVLCLLAVNDVPFSTITKEKYDEADSKQTYIAARAKEVLSWPTLKLSAYLDAFRLFEAKIINLSKEVQTVNFWKASA